MHRLSPFVVLLVMSALLTGSLALFSAATLSSGRGDTAAAVSSLVLFGGMSLAAIANAAVLGTLIAIERKVDRLQPALSDAATEEPSPPLGLSRKERRAIRASLPPRADGRL